MDTARETATRLNQTQSRSAAEPQQIQSKGKDAENAKITARQSRNQRNRNGMRNRLLRLHKKSSRKCAIWTDSTAKKSSEHNGPQRRDETQEADFDFDSLPREFQTYEITVGVSAQDRARVIERFTLSFADNEDGTETRFQLTPLNEQREFRSVFDSQAPFADRGRV